MKRLRYNWDDESWLIHVEIKNNNKADVLVSYFRIMDSPDDKEEEDACIKSGESRRFLVSRKSNKEKGIGIVFEEGVNVTVFKLLDRAYLPTSADICKLGEL
ncbi:MAG: hypothetical protein COS29_01060 [Candidatus Omnitrophica bacterium CG02_land_8_20_14_3_00__42_8]|nr:MAG: hypothetical protein COS29_01060 [Candidatus Omnitrophica bacterium CG02_land_8_20_14_3_00__42_8]PIW67260.1 MAG: hypothetical protein COW10_06635 [Candidatus Omnitrophica bacterium CG12_big_fil_rev_8_21_14_0_65_42_8]